MWAGQFAMTVSVPGIAPAALAIDKSSAGVLSCAARGPEQKMKILLIQPAKAPITDYEAMNCLTTERGRHVVRRFIAC